MPGASDQLFQTYGLPQSYCTNIRADHKVKLHCQVAMGPSIAKRVFTHSTGYSSSGSMSCSYITTVAYVETFPGLISMIVICPLNLAILLSYISGFITAEPIIKCLFLAHGGFKA